MMAMLAGAFASCSKEDISRSPGTEGTQSVTINLVADDAVNTRAAATGLSQYIIEVYSDAAYTTPENIFGEGATNQATSANGSFSLILDRTKEYYCLFWADKDAAAYTTATLKTVTLAQGKTPAEAWFGTQQISGNQPTQTITLKRAVAKLNLLETGKLIAGTTLTATFDQPTVFNVATGKVTNDSESRTETITLESTISGSKETPVQLGSDYFILSPVSTQYVAKVTFKCGEEEAFDVDNVPFQANRATNIKGHYTSLASETFNVTCNDDWDGDLNTRIWDGTYPTDDVAAKAIMTAAMTTDGGGTAVDYVFTITNVQDLAAMAYLVNNAVTLTGESSKNTYAHSQYLLAADLDLNHKAWTPIGESQNSFSGTFDGQGHIIRNMTVDITTTGTAIGAGFIGRGNKANIKNLIVEGTVSASGNKNVKAGGICGSLTYGNISFCRFNGTVSAESSDNASNSMAGGVTGDYTESEMTGCIGDATLTRSGGSDDSGSGALGGMFIQGTFKMSYSAWNSAKASQAYSVKTGITANATAVNSYTTISELNALLDGINAGAPDSEYIWQANSDPDGYPILVKRQ